MSAVDYNRPFNTWQVSRGSQSCLLKGLLNTFGNRSGIALVVFGQFWKYQMLGNPATAVLE